MVKEEEHPVELYVYDLSGGMASQLSLALTGKQMDGIWHTSVVVLGSEYFFGQGISIARPPGTSHHGRPLRIHHLGYTGIDPETLAEIMSDLGERFRPEDYNLLEWNCNHFSQELSIILTGNGIPQYIRNLPGDFLSTPFGSMLRPQIDAMFQRAGPSSTPPHPLMPSTSSNDMNQNLANQAQQMLNHVAATSTSLGNEQYSSTKSHVGDDRRRLSPVTKASNWKELQDIVDRTTCVAVLYTSETCPPCKVVQPWFHDLALQHTTKTTGREREGSTPRIAFVEVDSLSPLASELMSRMNIHVTPTVHTFLRGQRMAEVRGADTAEIKTQVELVRFEAFPPHPHTKLEARLKSIDSIPKTPQLYSNVPDLRSALSKLDRILSEEVKVDTFQAKADLQESRRFVSSRWIPWIEESSKSRARRLSQSELKELSRSVETILRCVPLEHLYPVLDLVRLSLLKEGFYQDTISLLLPLSGGGQGFYVGLLGRVCKGISNSRSSKEAGDASSYYKVTLTATRLVANLVASEGFLLSDVESEEGARVMTLTDSILEILTDGLLSHHPPIRTSASQATFNLCLVQALHPDHGSERLADLQAEVLTALLRSIELESSSDEALYRLTASLLVILYRSPHWSDHLEPLVQVLEASSILEKKISSVQDPKSRGILGDCLILCSS
ncbi:DUF862-domain-containing protein [Violaceomyces palustris]|uniref:DUF862-domain-containing protein n=1 Tax=Violaceomyces palustris TaxID=1673888 RepID=A0ACD0NSG0_9BASI|nr:DUF862-domain-containing protein [Violaceomyces palustris]